MVVGVALTNTGTYRWHMSLREEHYTITDARTLASLRYEHACTSMLFNKIHRMFAFGQTLSCNGKVNQHKSGICTPSPSDDIPVNHFVLDELHLLLRILDALFDNKMAWIQC